MGSYPWDVSCWISSINIFEHRLRTTSWSCRPGNGQKAVSQNKTTEQLGELWAVLISPQPLRTQIIQRRSRAQHQHIYVSTVPWSELVRTKHRLGLRQLDYQRKQQNRKGKVLILISRCKVQGTHGCDCNSPCNWFDVNKHSLTTRLTVKPQTKPMCSFWFSSYAPIRNQTWKWTGYTTMIKCNFWIKTYLWSQSTECNFSALVKTKSCFVSRFLQRIFYNVCRGDANENQNLIIYCLYLSNVQE